MTCIKQKIDFFEELYLRGIQIIIPEPVIDELEKLKQSQAIRLLEKSKFKEISLKGKIVDNSIINFAKENPEVIIATLDRDIQKKIKNKKMVIRGKKKLEII
jgi:rRNA-processing protein FCF1